VVHVQGRNLIEMAIWDYYLDVPAVEAPPPVEPMPEYEPYVPKETVEIEKKWNLAILVIIIFAVIWGFK